MSWWQVLFAIFHAIGKDAKLDIGIVFFSDAADVALMQCVDFCGRYRTFEFTASFDYLCATGHHGVCKSDGGSRKKTEQVSPVGDGACRACETNDEPYQHQKNRLLF